MKTLIVLVSANIYDSVTEYNVDSFKKYSNLKKCLNLFKN